MATQWRFAPAGMGGFVPVGLDYAAVRFGLRAAGIRVTPALWADLQVLEVAARDAMLREK